MSKSKNGGLDQYDAEPFEQQKYGTAGIEGVNGYISAFIRESNNQFEEWIDLIAVSPVLLFRSVL